MPLCCCKALQKKFKKFNSVVCYETKKTLFCPKTPIQDFSFKRMVSVYFKPLHSLNFMQKTERFHALIFHKTLKTFCPKNVKQIFFQENNLSQF